MSIKSSPADFLTGIRIIEIGRSDTVRLAGMLLADAGADVVRIDAARNAFSDSSFHRVTDRAKARFVFDASSSDHIAKINRLISNADVLLDDVDLEIRSSYGISQQALSKVIRCTVVPSEDKQFGGYWSEEAVSALCGLYEDGLGIGAPPRFYDLPIASTLGALYTINGVARALLGRQRFGEIDTVRIPLDRICLFAQSLTFMIRSQPPACWEPFRWLATPFVGVWRTGGGGYIYLHAGMPRHLRSFLFLLDKIGFSREKESIRKFLHPATKRDPFMVQSLREAMGISRILGNLFLKKDADEWEEILGEAGLCCTKLRTFDQWRLHPQVAQTDRILSCVFRDGAELPVLGPLFDSLRCSWATVAGEKSMEITDDNHHTLLLNKQMQPRASATRPPLEGIRVLDLGRVIAGPFCGRLFAEAGAQVVHLSLRENHLKWEEPFGIIYNRGKKSVVIDFTRQEGKDAFKKIFENFRPDVVIHNFLEDAAVKIGCDYDSCRKINEKVICIDFKGYDSKGPWADRPGFEQNIQAASGIISTFCGNTVPRILPVPLNDLCAGLIGSFGALAALLNRGRVNRGDRITAYISTPSLLVHLPLLCKQTASDRNDKFHRYFRASDGFFFLSATQDGLKRLAEMPLFTKENFKGDGSDVKSLDRVFRKKPIRWWIDKMKQSGIEAEISVIPRRSLSSILKKELDGKNPLFSYKLHQGFGMVLCAAPPLITPNGQVEALTTTPYPGSHNREVFREIGIDSEINEIKVPAFDNDNPPFVGKIREIVWILKQIKWLAVIAYRNRRLIKK